MMSTDWGSHQMSTSFFLFRYDLGTMSLNQVGELRKYHQFIGIFSTEKGTFDHKSTNQPKPPEESDETISLSFFVVITGGFVILIILKMLLH